MNAVDELNALLGIGPPKPRLPVTLERSGYNAVKQLGQGTFGQAYLIFHKRRNQYYVAKHINMATMSHKQRKEAHNEITILQQFKHPNIIRYEEFCEEHPHLYIVMEYADGGDLYGHINKVKASGGKLSEEQVMVLFTQIAMALQYMHDRKILHRDIKAQNIFLTKSHVVKLGDFGISTVLQNTMAMAKTMCGTPCYFSPELCRGQPYNNKSDVWALGVLLYEIATLKLPFEASGMKRLMDDIVSKEMPKIPSAGLSPELWALISSMLIKDPIKRPDINGVLRHPCVQRHIPTITAMLSGAAAAPSSSSASSSRVSSAAKGGGGGFDPRGDLLREEDDLMKRWREKKQREAAAAAAAGGGGAAPAVPSSASKQQQQPPAPPPRAVAPAAVSQQQPSDVSSAERKKREEEYQNLKKELTPYAPPTPSPNQAAADASSARLREAERKQIEHHENRLVEMKREREAAAAVVPPRQRHPSAGGNNNNGDHAPMVMMAEAPSSSSPIPPQSTSSQQQQQQHPKSSSSSPTPMSNRQDDEDITDEVGEDEGVTAVLRNLGTISKGTPAGRATLHCDTIHDDAVSSSSPNHKNGDDNNSSIDRYANASFASDNNNNNGQIFEDAMGTCVDIAELRAAAQEAAAATASMRSPNKSSMVSHATATTTVSSDNNNEDEDEDVSFEGSCLCGKVSYSGWLSYVYGSFTCNCETCKRFSGSGLGVEWLHLPSALFPEIVQPSEALRFFPKDAETNCYFCRRCGTSLAMEHPGIEGCVVSKATLNPDSSSVLQQYQQTVVGNGGTFTQK